MFDSVLIDFGVKPLNFTSTMAKGTRMSQVEVRPAEAVGGHVLLNSTTDCVRPHSHMGFLPAPICFLTTDANKLVYAEPCVYTSVSLLNNAAISMTKQVENRLQARIHQKVTPHFHLVLT